jgi:hypothetical protein
MDLDQKLALLQALKEDSRTLPGTINSREFTSWHSRSRSALARFLGEEHYITEAFMGVKWTPSSVSKPPTHIHQLNSLCIKLRGVG